MDLVLYNRIRNALRDWRRGYSQADLDSYRAKMVEPSWPGKIVPVTKRELRAMLDNP